MVEYSLAAGVRAKADRLRLRLGGWSDRDLAAMLAVSRGGSEDKDVRDERFRVEEAMTGATGSGGGGGGTGSRQGAADTVLIRGLTKACRGCKLFRSMYECVLLWGVWYERRWEISSPCCCCA